MVYRVLHVELGKPFVLKLARRRIDRASAAGTGLAAQGRLLAELDHPGLVPVVNLDIHEGRPFLVMDYVPGLNLAQYAAQRRRPRGSPRRSSPTWRGWWRSSMDAGSSTRTSSQRTC